MTRQEDDAIIVDLEKEAAQVLLMIEQNFQKRGTAKKSRPFFIEFSGTPKAGKTTIINSLRLFLSRNGYAVNVLVERASTSPIVDKVHLHFNVWTACATLIQMLDAAQWPDRNKIVILDRGLFDALAWMDWLRERDQLRDDDMQKVVEFLTIDHWRKFIDMVFIMLTTPQQSLLREYKDQVTKRPGRIMNEETIQRFNESLERTKQRFQPLFPEVTEVWTLGKTSPEETGREVVRKTLDTIRRILSPGTS
jgi:thymidylate kinase